MAETKGGPASTELNVSTLPPSPNAGHKLSPLTPSTVNTDMSVGGAFAQESPNDNDDDAAFSETPNGKSPDETNDILQDTNDDKVTSYDDDSLPSDEAEEDAKNASFDAQEAEAQPKELPFDAEAAEISKETPSTEDTGDVVEEVVAVVEETAGESATSKAPATAEANDENTSEIDAKVVEKEEKAAEESAPMEETLESAENNEEVAVPEAPEESPVEQEPLNETPVDVVEESFETAVEASVEEVVVDQTEEQAKESVLEETAELTVETTEDEVVEEKNDEENVPETDEPAMEVEPEAVEEQVQEVTETTVEASVEEVVAPEEPPQTESVESDAKTRRPSPVQVQFDVPDDDEQSDDNQNEETSSSAAMITPRSGGVSFVQAFSSSPQPAYVSPRTSLSKSPRSTSNASVSSTSTSSFNENDNDTPTSHSALSASKKKRASGLISRYQEKVAHELLPGDSVPIRSSSYKGYKFANVSPGTAKILQEKAAKSFVELNSLPDMNAVRAKFEKSSRKSGGKFEFGETFRQKQRHEQLSEKEREEEAKVNIRGFNEKVLNNGKTATAEIDTSNLPKSFTFDMSTSAPLFPNDGVCRVDYINADFRAKVFVVHKTRGMLLLQDKNYSITTSKSSGKKKKKRKSTVPGGKINEDEFLAAAKESGSPQVQLQIAAREAAARLVYETTGLDIRMQADRLKPAVLCMTPSMNAARGYEYLRNENEENLYYFLQVEEDDFQKLQEPQGDDAETPKLSRPSEDPGEDPAPAKLKRPSVDPGDDPVPLKLSSDYFGFEFVQDPAKASKVLKKDGNDAAIALAMIMSAAQQEISGSPTSEDVAMKEPDAKATEFANKSMLDDESDEEDDLPPVDGTIRTVGVKEDTEDNAAEAAAAEAEAAKAAAEAEAAAKAEAEKAEAEKAKAETAAAEEQKLVEEKTLFHDDVNIHLKTSSESMAEPVGVSCCCGFW